MKIFLTFLCVFIFCGCEYVPQSTFEIEAKNGDIIVMSCPVIAANRSNLTYLYDGDCIVNKVIPYEELK